MKKSLAIISAAILATALLTGCGRPAPKAKSPAPKPAPKAAPAKPAPAPAPNGGVRQGVKEAAGVADYVIGAGQLQAGQKMKKKVQNINQQHNKELEDALK